VQSRWRYHFSFPYAQCPCPPARSSTVGTALVTQAYPSWHRDVSGVSKDGDSVLVVVSNFVKAERSTNVKLAR
jgi:hypothetical protein